MAEASDRIGGLHPLVPDGDHTSIGRVARRCFEALLRPEGLISTNPHTILQISAAATCFTGTHPYEFRTLEAKLVMGRIEGGIKSRIYRSLIIHALKPSQLYVGDGSRG